MSNPALLVKHTSIYAIGSISRQLVGFIMLPVYTRYLTPADYGVIGLIAVAFIIVERLFGARLVEAVPKFYYEQEDGCRQTGLVVSTAMFVTAIVCTASMAILMIFRNELSDVVFGTREYGLVVLIYSATLLTSALEHYGLTYIRILQKPFLFVAVSIMKLALSLSMNIWLIVFLDMGVLGAAISAAVSSAVFAGILTIYSFSKAGVGFSLSLAKKMLVFTWPLWLSGLAGIYIWTSNRYFIRIFSSLDEVGLFQLAAKFASILMVLCWGPFFQYWQTERFHLYNQGDASAAFRSVFYFISTILIIVALGISIFSDPVIRVMADSSFHSAIKVVPFLVLGTLFAALLDFANFGFYAKGKTGVIARNYYITAVLLTVAYLVMIPAYGYYGAGIALMIAQSFQFYLSHIGAKRLNDSGISLRPLVVLLAVAATGYVISNIVFETEDIIFGILLKLLIYSVVTVVLIAILMRDKEQRNRIFQLIAVIRNEIKLNRAQES